MIKSIKFIQSAIEKGIFDELAYGYWTNEDFNFQGRKGIPLSPDILSGFNVALALDLLSK